MKSTGLAYVLWFFLGSLGIHKFYLGNTKMGIVYLLLSLIGWVTVYILIGWVFLAILAILWLIDLFTLPSQVRTANDLAAKQIAEFNKKVSDNMMDK